MVNPETGLYPKSGLNVTGPGRVVFSTSDASSYPGVTLNAVSNVNWQVDIVGDAATHVGDGSPGCHAVRVTGGSDNRIACTISNSPGDGVYINTNSQRAAVNVVLDNCGRQGVAVVDADDYVIERVIASNIAGGAVHIEPNEGESAHGGIVRNVQTTNCGEAITATAFAEGSSIDSLTVEDCTADGCTNDSAAGAAFGFYGIGALALNRLTAQNSAANGFRFEDMGTVEGSDCHALDNAGYGYYADENPGNSASYAFEDSSASGNEDGGALWVNTVPVLTDCEGMA